MKKKLLIILTLCVVFCLILTGLMACSHEHNFNGRRVSEKYLASPATCTEKAKYYFSCDCGKIDVETFEYGKPLDHAYSDWVSNGNSAHTKTCANDSTHTITEDCSGGTATCTEQAICVDCGAGYGRLEEHHFGNDGICIGCSISISITDGIIYRKSADGTYMEVIGYEGTAKQARIADTYNGLPVKTICDSAFYNNCNITTVIIPDSVTSIGADAFYNCSSLTSVTIGNSVTSIGENAFYGCKYIVKSSANYIGDENNPYAILVSIIYKDSSTYRINANAKYINSCAFKECDSLTNIEIPDSVIFIGNSAFYRCRTLKSIVIPNSVTFIGENAFEWCSSLTSIAIPNSVTAIGDGVFANCSSLTSIEIPDSVTSIGENAFANCFSLRSVTIPNSVVSIGTSAFSCCGYLTNLVIPNSVISIGASVFSCCGLEYIYCEAKSKPSCWNYFWNYNCNAQVVWGYKGD